MRSPRALPPFRPATARPGRRRCSSRRRASTARSKLRASASCSARVPLIAPGARPRHTSATAWSCRTSAAARSVPLSVGATARMRPRRRVCAAASGPKADATVRRVAACRRSPHVRDRGALTARPGSRVCDLPLQRVPMGVPPPVGHRAHGTDGRDDDPREDADDDERPQETRCLFTFQHGRNSDPPRLGARAIAASSPAPASRQSPGRGWLPWPGCVLRTGRHGSTYSNRDRSAVRESRRPLRRCRRNWHRRRAPAPDARACLDDDDVGRRRHYSDSRRVVGAGLCTGFRLRHRRPWSSRTRTSEPCSRSP